MDRLANMLFVIILIVCHHRQDGGGGGRGSGEQVCKHLSPFSSQNIFVEPSTPGTIQLQRNGIGKTVRGQISWWTSNICGMDLII